MENINIYKSLSMNFYANTEHFDDNKVRNV